MWRPTTFAREGCIPAYRADPGSGAQVPIEPYSHVIAHLFQVALSPCLKAEACATKNEVSGGPPSGVCCPLFLSPTSATFSELRRLAATKRVSQAPGSQDPATQRELD